MAEASACASPMLYILESRRKRGKYVPLKRASLIIRRIRAACLLVAAANHARSALARSFLRLCWLYNLVATGLILFGVFSRVMARFRGIRDDMSSGG